MAMEDKVVTVRVETDESKQSNPDYQNNLREIAAVLKQLDSKGATRFTEEDS